MTRNRVANARRLPVHEAPGLTAGGTDASPGALMEIAETDVMADPCDLRSPDSGLHPNHYAAVRAEVVRTGAILTDEQLLDLADALHSLIRLRRPGRPIRRSDAWVEGEPRAFARG